jgi:predicted DCC family thiol-disulfide oxidoreductase YuxK
VNSVGKNIIFYDGNCTLCKETKRIFTKLDWLDKTEWKSIQQIENEKKYSFLNEQDLKKEMHLVTRKGKVFKGFFAVRRLAIFFPLTVFLGLLAYIPFFSLIGVPLYRYVAKNRHKFLRAKCKDGSCTIR